jgi:outer membrane receptor protein involved in Fe transport
VARAAALAALAALSLPAAAQPRTERVEISGERARVPATRVTQDIEAAPASTTVLDRRDLDRLSVTTYGDLFRNLTGVFVNDYGQGLVAYEIKLRGFPSGHGRDIAFSLDGVPLNITGSQHTNGYADLALLIAETVDRVEVVRGPFSAAAGNHAVAGAVNFFTDRNTRSQLKLDVDSFGRVRALPIFAGAAGPGRLLLALDATKGPGYQDQTDLERGNLFVRYGIGLGAGQASLRLQHYDADADAPGYIDLAQVRSGALSPKAALSPGIGDAKRQTNLVLNYRSDDIEGRGGLASGWSGTVYAVRDDRRRWTNFDLDTPPGARVNLGAERDRLEQHGLDLRKATSFGAAAAPLQLLLGAQFNDERVDALTFGADASRRPLGDAAVSAQRDVTTRTSAAFAELQASPVAGFKVQAGLRVDRIEFGVELQPLDDAFGGAAGNRFADTKSQLSPKLGLAWALLQGPTTVELFANAARGLKSPYTFGDFNRLPQSNITPLTSYELGVQGAGAALGWRAALWQTRQEKEALFDAANRFIGNQRTDRDGFDLEGRLELSRALRVTANISTVRARVLGQGANDRIPNVPDWTAGLGVEGRLGTGAGPLEWSIIDSIVGPQPLLADNSVRTQSYHRIVARAALAPPVLGGGRIALTLTHVTRPYAETVFDFGGGRYGVSAKPRWKALLSAQALF